jgi:hypothetical protein
MRNVLIAVALAGLAGGCREAAAPNPVRPTTPETELRDLGEMFQLFAQENRRPPKNLADLGTISPEPPPGYLAAEEGRIVVLWGGAFTTGAGKSAVMAYEKDAPNRGGFVLLQDGTVKQMNAAEFQAAPKAK